MQKMIVEYKSNRNPIAKMLSDRLFAKRIVVAKKGKGSYNRKKHKDGE